MVIRFLDRVLLSKNYDPLPKDPPTDAVHCIIYKSADIFLSKRFIPKLQIRRNN